MVFATAPVFGVLASALWLENALRALQILAAAHFAGAIALLRLGHSAHEHWHEALDHEHAHSHDDEHHDHLHR
ncbi:MAG: hypothetical protein DHS20C15_03930 [Planctomycetota bacterium]|nr:MAG: hypothetical protein DHS20C15_03930 [Planctomycetota bacterium]